MTKNVSDREREIIRQALGLTQGTNAYRNHFAAGGDDLAVCQQLEARGLAVRMKAPGVPDPVFGFSSQAASFVMERNEHLSSETQLHVARVDDALRVKRGEAPKLTEDDETLIARRRRSAPKADQAEASEDG